jgi:hypothetical protein
MAGVSVDEHLKSLMTIAISRSFKELQQALQQRYPEFGGGH